MAGAKNVFLTLLPAYRQPPEMILRMSPPELGITISWACLNISVFCFIFFNNNFSKSYTVRWTGKLKKKNEKNHNTVPPDSITCSRCVYKDADENCYEFRSVPVKKNTLVLQKNTNKIWEIKLNSRKKNDIISPRSA